MALAPGTRIGSYEIVAQLGAGGMGEVYRSIDRRLGRTVALKVLPPSLALDPERLERFEREAKAVAELTHPNILNIFDFGRDGDVVYAAFELVEGVTLRARLTDAPLPPRKAMDIARQMALGLAAAHTSGILHRDIKPDNVMVTESGHVKLLDFGLARRVASAQDGTESLENLTDTGKVLGTVGYMAPEQVRGAAIDERTDVFSLGVVLHEMLSGRAPFARPDRADTLAAILRDDAPPLGPSVPLPLRRIVERCLEKAPAGRYQSALDLAFTLDALERAAETETATATEATRRAPSGRRIVPIMLIAATALLATATLWWTRGSASLSREPAFERVTYRRGSVFEARFAPGGRAVVYGAAWEGQPAEVFDVLIGSRDSRARSLAPALPLALTPSGDLAVLLAPVSTLRTIRTGRLAVMTPSGAPRPVANDVTAADWSPDGRSLAVARVLGPDRTQIEWPLGNVVTEIRQHVSGLRVSPEGRRLAWLQGSADHDGFDLVVWDRTSGTSVVAPTAEASPGGLAWSPDGKEIWFTAGRSATLGDIEVRAAVPGGSERTVLALPGGARLFDISPDGSVLISQIRESIELRVDDGQAVHDVGWFTSSFLRDISADGQRVLFSEDGPNGFDLYLRDVSGAPAVRLAEGARDLGLARLSPDGKWVAWSAEGKLVVLGVHADDRREVEGGGPVRGWFPDGRRVLVWARGLYEGHPAIVSVDPEGGEREIVNALTCVEYPVLSISGQRIACDIGGRIGVYTAGAGVQTVSPTVPTGLLIGWSTDDRGLFAALVPVQHPVIQTIDVTSGRVSVLRKIDLPDITGIWRVRPVLVTPDGRTVAYTTSRQLDDLYVYRNLH